MSLADDEVKQSPLSVFTTEDDLSYMKRHREEIVQQIGQDKYDRLVKELEDHIYSREQSKPSADTEF